ncbi:unnamed protein product [Didymodactylos carnosus]|uniref:Uncharacterized protein n=1 Tax=Didymodactylos carnosus TaxID=1234261 RepID=A0A815EL89_9BILA|nr:unnamed protein product [Didymodactylos carnosus]CAF1382207.1 unnamed protein product [Didymodactylos carnosus]CAF4154091.1 unnamed protein product [Didymodactylos carnosus]CAF4190632.1 unnamed protein product [Didymodactylos carnosus]
MNGQSADPRVKFLLEKLVDHIHDYARETQLTSEEWMVGLRFLTKCGQMCTDIRQEFILLSDVLGLSALVDALNNPKPPTATESTVLGPFHTDDAPDVANGESIASPGKGEKCLVIATVKDIDGKPIEGAKIDVWETDGNGHYDVEYDERDRPDMRGCLTSNKNGEFYFKCVRPVSYTVPTDGPVGELLKNLDRHSFRPAHIHFRINVPGDKYSELITTLFLRGDPHLTTDAVFGVKRSLIVDLGRIEDGSIAKKYDADEQDWLIKWDFVMTTIDEANALKKNLERKNDTL